MYFFLHFFLNINIPIHQQNPYKPDLSKCMMGNYNMVETMVSIVI